MSAVQNLPALGVGTTASGDNALAVRGAATLCTHNGAGHRITVNKATEADTASLVFQTNWSGRAEFGLAGSDAFGVKVSADGADWKTAFSVTPDSGDVTIQSALRVTPGPEPLNPQKGLLYFDETANSLRCWDGSQWRNIF